MRGSLPGVRGSPGLAAVSGAAARGRRSRLNTCKGSTHQALLDGPPAGYSHTAELRQASLAFCAAHYPALVPQVEAGSLLVWQRPADYQERRSDGYREPEVIFLCGTAHMSKQSAADVQLLVQTVEPENVVIELCKSRLGLIQELPTPEPEQDDAAAAAGQLLAARAASSSQGGSSVDSSSEEGVSRAGSPGGSESASSSTSTSGTSRSDSSSRARKARNALNLSGSSLVEALGRSLSLGGQRGLLLRLLLANQARKASDKLGVESGAEFRAAARAADLIDAQLVLGDRPIEITLGRAWDALSWQQRAALVSLLVQAAAAPLPEELSEAMVERLRSDDAVSALFQQMSDSFPQLLSPLVHERDLYLAWSMKRSKAVNGTRRVVGVVGKGHLRGVVYALLHDNGRLRFADLTGGANRKAERRKRVLVRVAWELALGAGCYAAWLALTATP